MFEEVEARFILLAVMNVSLEGEYIDIELVITDEGNDTCDQDEEEEDEVPGGGGGGGSVKDGDINPGEEDEEEEADEEEDESNPLSLRCEQSRS